MPKSALPTPPARGERAAAAGYHPQYRGGAALILRRLTEGTLISIRLADTGAGKLDDLQIRGNGRLDAYQVKWSRYPGNFTFNDLIGGASGQSLLASLVEGWWLLRAANPGELVVPHLVSNELPSSATDLPGLEDAEPPRHLAAFLSEFWEARQAREPTDLASKWVTADARLQEAAGCSVAEWREFTAACRLEFGSTLDQFPGGGGAREEARWEENVVILAQHLFAQVASPRAKVEHSRADLFALLGWTDESAPRHVHEFPVDERVYEPIRRTVDQLVFLQDSMVL